MITVIEKVKYMDKNIATLFVVLILILIGVAVYDQYEYIHTQELKKLGYIGSNVTTPTLIPKIPYQFVNIIFFVVAIVIVIGLFVYVFRRLA